jgi:type I restriction enzyme, S subunit
LFDSNRYKVLLDKLEISELKISEVLKDNEEFRFDSEFFGKTYTHIIQAVTQGRKLSEVTKSFDLQSNGAFKQIFEILNDGNEKEIPYIRSGNVGDTFLNFSSLDSISKEAHSKLLKTQTKFHDILMARKGKIGGATLITEDDLDYNSNDNVVNLKITHTDFNPFYFVTFFNSKYGIKQVERLATGNVQPWLSMNQIRLLKIPILPQQFQLHIETLVKTAHTKLQESKKLYDEAENILLTELGLKNWQPTQDKLNISIKTLSQSWGTSGRLDAEYYQPKYEQILEKIKKFKHKNLGGENGLVNIFKSIEPGSEAYCDKGIPFVRVSNLYRDNITEPEIKLDSIDFDSVKKPYKEDILLSKDGSVGIAYKCQKDEEFITSSAILHLTVRDFEVVLPDYLTLVLSSIITKLQAERDAGGSIIQHWKPSEIEQIIIPLLPIRVQKVISEKIQESFLLRLESKNLLDQAKLEVEQEIEK